MKPQDLEIADLQRDLRKAQAQLRDEQKHARQLMQLLREGFDRTELRFEPQPTAKRAAKAAKHKVRVIVPDSHGNHIDPIAARVFLRDFADLAPDEAVWVGDHTDCGGLFSAHQRQFTNELTESYEDDTAACNGLLDAAQKSAPNCEHHYIEGNHEQHVERWIARTFTSHKDAVKLLEMYGPEGRLHLKARGFKYYRTSEFYCGLTVPGTLKLGKCHFTHGISHSKHADSTHLERFNGNVVFGHVHRSMSVIGRTVSSQGHGAWCPGTLAKLQPLYKHTNPTTWTWGYGLQFVNANSGRFTHFNVPIYADGTSGLSDLVGGLKR